MHHRLNDTIVAPATSQGEGAIAIIRLSGNDAISLTDKFFTGKNLNTVPSNVVSFGTIKGDENNILDEVLVTIFRNPRSYTGEDLVEISCHASPYIIRELIENFIRLGARLAEPGEFTMRAYLNGKLDLSQAEAVADLIASESKAGHNIAMAQMRGNFSSKIEMLRLKLIDFASLLELELDFSEEDVEFADRDELKELLNEVLAVVNKLIASFKLGNVLKKGVPTVISGRPNAGKSTLLNVLLQEDRAIVSEIEGTTRDTIEETLNIDGVLFRFIDTAGIRKTEDAIEATGVKKTLEHIGKSALVLYLFDLATQDVEDIKADINSFPETQARIILIANKMDKANGNKKLEDVESAFPEYALIPISAKQEQEIEALKQELYNQVIGDTAFEDRVIISNTRHLEALQKVRDNLTVVDSGLQTGVPSDLVAMDLRQALHYLGSITGAIGTEDLLGNIFGKFCIGK